jgi:hypothetical protein
VPLSRKLPLKRGYNPAYGRTVQQLVLFHRGGLGGLGGKIKKHQLYKILNIILILTKSKTASQEYFGC